MAIADAEGFNAPEGNMSATDVARLCRSAGVLRPWHAGRETSKKNLGSPRRTCTWKTWEDGLQLLRHRRGNPETERDCLMPQLLELTIVVSIPLGPSVRASTSYKWAD